MCNVISIEEFVNPNIKIIPSNSKKEEDNMAEVKISEIPNVQGFSIPLIRVLLKMLKNLNKKNEIFDKNEELSACARIATNLLQQQLNISVIDDSCYPKRFKRFIETVEKFLAEFEEVEREVERGEMGYESMLPS